MAVCLAAPSKDSLQLEWFHIPTAVAVEDEAEEREGSLTIATNNR